MISYCYNLSHVIVPCWYIITVTSVKINLNTWIWKDEWTVYSINIYSLTDIFHLNLREIYYPQTLKQVVSTIEMLCFFLQLAEEMQKILGHFSHSICTVHVEYRYMWTYSILPNMFLLYHPPYCIPYSTPPPPTSPSDIHIHSTHMVCRRGTAWTPHPRAWRQSGWRLVPSPSLPLPTFPPPDFW